MPTQRSDSGGLISMLEAVAEMLRIRIYSPPDIRLPHPAPTNCWKCGQAVVGSKDRIVHCIIQLPDSPDYELDLHHACFDALRDHGVEANPDPPRAGLQARPRCMICAEPIPSVGRHPLNLLARSEGRTSRYWLHAHCWPAAATS